MSDNNALEWRFSQVFGDGRAADDVTDIVSAIEFDDTGNYIAVGDRGGRIVVFEQDSSKKKNVDYKFWTEFQSHEPEFDYLKSLEIEEKVNKIKWCKRQNQAHFLISTNGTQFISLKLIFTQILDKTIKLWKIFEKKVKTGTNSVKLRSSCVL